MKERLDYLDRAKGYLIILVVIGHIWQSGPVFNVIYAFHMPAFFLISGILFRHTKAYQRPFGTFLKSRLFAFGVPFVFIEILGILTDIVRHGVTLNIKGYLYNTLSFHFNDHNLWFIMDLFFIELLLYVLIKAIRDKRLLVLTVILLYAASRLLPKENAYIGTIRSVLYYDLYFTCGFCAAELFKRFHAAICVIAAAIVLAVGLLLGKNDNTSVLKDLVYLISGVGGAYAIIQLGKLRLGRVSDRALLEAGKNTITIYGTHHFYYAVIAVLLGATDFAKTPLVPGLIMLFGVALLEIPTILAINRWCPWLAGKRRKNPSVPHGIEE